MPKSSGCHAKHLANAMTPTWSGMVIAGERVRPSASRAAEIHLLDGYGRRELKVLGGEGKRGLDYFVVQGWVQHRRCNTHDVRPHQPPCVLSSKLLKL